MVSQFGNLKDNISYGLHFQSVIENLLQKAELADRKENFCCLCFTSLLHLSMPLFPKIFVSSTATEVEEHRFITQGKCYILQEYGCRCAVPQ